MKWPRKILQAIPKPLRHRFERMWWPLLLRMPRLASIYYAFDGSYVREHRAVLHGRKVFESRIANKWYVLRRNTHRLEKGLIMRPQKGVFAEKYIEPTVDMYVQLLEGGEALPEQEAKLLAAWSGDVLIRYFQTVPKDQSKVIERSRSKFEQATSLSSASASDCAPYQRDLSTPPVSYEALLALAHRRRSVRFYLPKPVPREMIDQAIEVAKLSPSACNRQPFEFRIYDDPELIPAVASIPGGTAGFVQGFPCIIVLVGRLGAFGKERDRHVIYIDGSLAAMSLQFALETLGLSSCCINWPDLPESEAAMTKLINLEPEQRVVMLLSVGFPDPEGQVPFSQKKSLAQLRSYNRL